jgi:hypothetical protein
MTDQIETTETTEPAAAVEPKKVRKPKAKKAPKLSRANSKPKKAAAPRRRAEPDEGEEDADEGHSVVPPKYRAAYREQGGTCGTPLAAKLKAHLQDANGKLDVAHMKRFMKANGIEDWPNLNIGQRKMLLSLKLRSMEAKGEKIAWVK